MSTKAQRRRERRRQEGQRRGSRVRTYSFIATLLLIAIAVGASYVGSLPRTEHIPSDFKFSAQPWMSIVPKAVQYVSYVDFQQVMTVSGNATILGIAGLIEFSQLNLTIFPQDVLYEVDIQLQGKNTAVTVLKLKSDIMNELEFQFARSTKVPSWTVGIYLIRELSIRTPTQQGSSLGYLSPAYGYAVISADAQTGRDQVGTVITQIQYGLPSFFDNSTIQTAVYSSGIRGESYIALFLGMFSSQLTGSEMIVKSIMSDSSPSGTVSITRSVLFRNQDTALSQYGEAQRIYRDASSYTVLDSWLVITYVYSADHLRTEVRGI